MITNIIDERARPYRFLDILAIVEAAFHDNSCRDSDQVLERSGPLCDERGGITLAEAIAWANSYSDPVTLFLYDRPDGSKYYGFGNSPTPCADVQGSA
jgi:hypothetical protein